MQLAQNANYLPTTAYYADPAAGDEIVVGTWDEL
jgi:hypothetical protein